MTISTSQFIAVNVGSTANDGTGDALREAFVKVNGNFANIVDVGFDAGNIVVNTQLEVLGTAKIDGDLFVNSIKFTDTTTLTTSPQSYIDSQIATVNGNITIANVAMKGYVDSSITNLINVAPGTLDTLGEIASALGNDANLATTLTTKITNVQSNVTVVANGLDGANTAIITANVDMKGYVDTNITSNVVVLENSISGANTAIITANIDMKGYVDNKVSSIFTDNNTFTGLNTFSTIKQSNVTIQSNNLSNATPTWSNIAMPASYGGLIWVTGNSGLSTDIASFLLMFQNNTVNTITSINDTALTISFQSVSGQLQIQTNVGSYQYTYHLVSA